MRMLFLSGFVLLMAIFLAWGGTLNRGIRRTHWPFTNSNRAIARLLMQVGRILSNIMQTILNKLLAHVSMVR